MGRQRVFEIPAGHSSWSMIQMFLEKAQQQTAQDIPASQDHESIRRRACLGFRLLSYFQAISFAVPFFLWAMGENNCIRY